LQCVAVCCSVLQCVAVCCMCYMAVCHHHRSISSCFAVWCSVVQRAVVCCVRCSVPSIVLDFLVSLSVLQHVCSVLQYVAVCCSVLQYVAVCYHHRLIFSCCRMLQYTAVCCIVLQCAAMCCSMLQCAAMCCSMLQCTINSVRSPSQFQCAAACLQCAAACCSVLQCVTNTFRFPRISVAASCRVVQFFTVCPSVLKFTVGCYLIFSVKIELYEYNSKFLLLVLLYVQDSFDIFGHTSGHICL